MSVSTEIVGDLKLDAEVFARNFDREPFAFDHDLSALPMFEFASLVDLAGRYAHHPNDCFVAGSAATAGSAFYSVTHGHLKPREAMLQLDSSAVRVLLKRPENHDARFRSLLDRLFAQIVALRGGLRGEKVVRLESAVFITSSSSTTPFHFDPEIAFFSQIHGEKIYHVYSPRVVAEQELEDFYLHGIVNIGQVALEGRDQSLQHTFTLSAGRGLHQPQNSPHWVETRAERSVSYSFVFETDATRAAGRTRGFNHYVRKAGLNPRSLGARPTLDAIKAESMRALIPMRRQASRLLKGAGRS